MPRKKPITAKELMQQLESDPEWVARRAVREAAHEKIAAQRRENEEPLVLELRQAGVDVQSAWRITNKTTNYLAALPVLLRHMEFPYEDFVRGGIIRALGYREARPHAWDRMIDRMRADWSSYGAATRQGFMATIAGMALPSD